MKNELFLLTADGGGAFEKLEQLEKSFLDNFCETMEQCNFNLLTENEWNFALAEDFSMPGSKVSIDFDKLDGKMLPRFFRSIEQQNEGAAKNVFGDGPYKSLNLLNSILVFHRGTGEATLEGLFLEEKIDLFFTYATRNICYVFRCCRGGKGGSSSYTPSRKGYTVVGDVECGELEPDDGNFAERTNLEDALPTMGSIVSNFLSTVRLTEPSFKQVVLLFRDSEDAKTSCSQTRHGFHIKSFRDIPMSDLEIVFPYIHVGYNVLDVVKCMVMSVVAAMAVLQKIFGEGDGSGGKALILVVMFLAATKAYQTYAAMQSAKQKTRDVLTRVLARQMLDSDRGVLLELLDSMEEQEVPPP
jgi:hypothetical protein